MSDTLIFKGNPVAKPRMTKRDKWLNPPRPCVAKYWAFKDEINKQADEQDFKLCDMFRVTFYVEIPKSRRTGKNKVVAGQPHKQRPDGDNLEKALNDCLRDEDSGIWYVVRVKRWADEPGIKVENFPQDLDF